MRRRRFPATGIHFREFDVLRNPAPRPVDRTHDLGLAQMPVAEAHSVRSLNPRPLRIIGTHFSARAARVLACFAPEI